MNSENISPKHFFSRLTLIITPHANHHFNLNFSIACLTSGDFHDEERAIQIPPNLNFCYRRAERVGKGFRLRIFIVLFSVS